MPSSVPTAVPTLDNAMLFSTSEPSRELVSSENCTNVVTSVMAASMIFSDAAPCELPSVVPTTIAKPIYGQYISVLSVVRRETAYIAVVDGDTWEEVNNVRASTPPIDDEPCQVQPQPQIV